MDISATGFQAYAGFQSKAAPPAVGANGLGAVGAVDTAAAETLRSKAKEVSETDGDRDDRRNSGYTTPTRGSNLNVVV